MSQGLQAHALGRRALGLGLGVESGGRDVAALLHADAEHADRGDHHVDRVDEQGEHHEASLVGGGWAG